MDTPDGCGALNYGIRVPKGVIGVICPWNLPLLLMTWKVGPALACGNTVVVKPSEETPATATLLGEVMNEVGIPPGVYNVINGTGPGAAGELLAKHSGVDALTFTGGTATGEAIMRNAAAGVRDVSFELGGKNAGIVFADSNFEQAVDGITRAAFANCGQVCLGTERVYVQRPIFDAFIDALKARAESFTPGLPISDSTDIGPMVSRQQLRKVLTHYGRATEYGAEVVTGGGVPEMPSELAGGFWIEPTIWIGLSEQSPIVKEEIFGPCCHVRPFDDEEEVIALANDTDYGLAVGVLTNNFRKARILRDECEAGMIYWNGGSIAAESHLAFGGVKKSGNGFPSAARTFRAVTHEISWTVNHADKLTFPQGMK